MKYLKRYYESFSNVQNDIDNLKDIILDINDLGFNTNVFHDNPLQKRRKSNIIITIRSENTEEFIRNKQEFNTMRDVLNRIKEYSDFSGYEIDLTWIERINEISIIILT
jgi:hypothetical protein